MPHRFQPEGLAASKAKHLIEAKSTQWIPLGDLDGERTLSCIDGRERGCAIGVPGGTLGELLIVLSAIEDCCDIRFNEAEVVRAFGAVLEHHGSFRAHTDYLSVSLMLTSSGVDPGDPEELADRIRSLTAEEAQRVLPHLLIPTHHGCGHLASVLESPGTYDIRPELLAMVIRRFFEVLWSGEPRVHLAVLEGIHEEQAIVEVDVASEPNALHRIPAIEQREDLSVLLHHWVAQRWLITRMVETICATFERRPNPSLRRHALALARRHVESTLTRLAPHLERVHVTLDHRATGEFPPVVADPEAI